MLVEILVGNSDIEYFFITVIEYNHHFSVKNCHLEVYYIVEEDSILCDNSKQRVSIFKWIWYKNL